MSSTSGRWNTCRRGRIGCAWWNRRGGPRWCISPFPLTPTSCPSWLRHSFSCVMVELAMISTNPPECTWNRLETMDSLQISFKTPSPAHTTHSQPIASLQMTKRKPKICFKANPDAFFRVLCVLFSGFVSCFRDTLSFRVRFVFFRVPNSDSTKSRIGHEFRSNRVWFDPHGTRGASRTNPIS